MRATVGRSHALSDVNGSSTAATRWNVVSQAGRGRAVPLRGASSRSAGASVTTAAQPSKRTVRHRSFKVMHPIERLRYVARAGGVDQGELVREAAAALSGLSDDPGGLIMSCRRLVARHPTAGALWFLCARLLTAADIRAEAWNATEALEHDPTPNHLVRLLPEEARLTVVGYPELAALGLPKRGDVEVLAIDASGDGTQLARRLRNADVDAIDVP